MPEIQQVRPKYLQVSDHIRQQILNGDLAPGDEVPSERRLVEEWGISRPTATRALATLRSDGLVESRQGAGTFVRAQPRLHRRAHDRYRRSRETGRAYTPSEASRITDAELVPAPGQVAEELGVEAGDEVIRRRRVISDASGPVEVSTSWFSGRLADSAPRLLQARRIRKGTLAYIEDATGRRARTGRDRVTSRLVTQEEAADLELERPAAVLLVHHTILDTVGDVIEFAEAVFPPGPWMFEGEYRLD